MRKRILKVVDVSSYIHAGAVNKSAVIDGPIVQTDRGYTSRDIAAGGASLIFNLLYYSFNEDTDFLFCCDRRPTIKQEMFPDYKGSRHHAENILKSKEVTEIILRDCGFTILAEEGYEADDFIYSAVKKFHDQYDEIHIHTGDSDLYFLVDDKVSIQKSHSRTKIVTKMNYGKSFKKITDNMPYNMSSFYKVCFGDSSDDIPPISDKEAARNLYRSALGYFPAHMGNKEYARQFVDTFAPWALPQFDLVYPLDTDVPDDISKGNAEKIYTWGKVMKNKLFSNIDGKVAEETTQDIVAEMVAMGLYMERE